MRAYTPYTAVAEKLEAMIVLGNANSRIKDYYDLAVLPQTLSFDGATLVESIRRTFARRSTRVPKDPPEGMRDSFAEEPLNAGRWRAFIAKGRLTAANRSFLEIVRSIRRFALPTLIAVRDDAAFEDHWSSGGPWRKREEASSSELR